MANFNSSHNFCIYGEDERRLIVRICRTMHIKCIDEEIEKESNKAAAVRLIEISKSFEQVESSVQYKKSGN